MVQHAPNAVDALCKVDRKVVAELRGLAGGTDLYSRLVDLFRTGSADALAQLRTALAEAGLQRARTVCHRLKSSAANVGALAFSAQVGRLEDLCAAGDIAAARAVFDELQSAHPALLAALSHS